MAYRELLEALGSEVRRQAEEIRAAAHLEAARRREAAVRDGEARRTAALASTQAELDREREDELEPVRRETREVCLRAQRAALDRLREDARTALAALDSPAILERLLEEILPEIGPRGAGSGRAELRVNPTLLPALQEMLSFRGLEGRVDGKADASLSGAGVVAVCAEGRRRLDDSLDSRLDAAWTALEGEIAGRLFAESPRAPATIPLAETAGEETIGGRP